MCVGGGSISKMKWEELCAIGCHKARRIINTHFLITWQREQFTREQKFVFEDQMELVHIKSKYVSEGFTTPIQSF